MASENDLSWSSDERSSPRRKDCYWTRRQTFEEVRPRSVARVGVGTLSGDARWLRRPTVNLGMREHVLGPKVPGCYVVLWRGGGLGRRAEV